MGYDAPMPEAFLSALDDEGEIRETVIVPETLLPLTIRTLETAQALGFSLLPSLVGDGLHPSRRCASLAEVAAWLHDLAQWSR